MSKPKMPDLQTFIVEQMGGVPVENPPEHQRVYRRLSQAQVKADHRLASVVTGLIAVGLLLFFIL